MFALEIYQTHNFKTLGENNFVLSRLTIAMMITVDEMKFITVYFGAVHDYRERDCPLDSGDHVDTLSGT